MGESTVELEEAVQEEVGLTRNVEELNEMSEDIKANVDVVSDWPVYILYALNVHDWVHPEESASTVRRVILLHEQYDIPIEVFVTDPLFQWYVENDSDLVELMRSSEMVSMSYHIRVPYPYYQNFDWYGLSELETGEREEILLGYEEHRLDLETGFYTDAPGGYQFMKDTIGYAPRIVGIFDSQVGGQVLANIYKEKGVEFIVQHNKLVHIGDQKYGIYARPEHYDLKIYEYAQGDHTAEEIFETITEKMIYDHPQFIGVKYHENNFYHDDNPWYGVFWENGKTRKGPKSPPYDLSMSFDDFRTEEEVANHWELYEESLRYIKERPEEYKALNAVGLLEEFEWE